MLLFFFYISKDEGIIRSIISIQSLDSIGLFSEGVGSKKSVLYMGLLTLFIDFLFKHIVRLVLKINSLQTLRKEYLIFCF